MPTQKPYMKKFLKFQRSAMAPVGIVAVVSMNTTSNKNKEKTAVSKTDGLRKNPLPPQRPNGFPNKVIECSTLRRARPCPSDGCQPMGTGAVHQPPNMIAYPQIQNPTIPRP